MTPKTKVLFVCVGNSCRSQMAEGFARAYGADVMEAQSAGLMPASIVAPLTRQVMAEKSIRLDGHFPKTLGEAGAADLVVNLSGYPIPGSSAPSKEWAVRDPIGGSEKLYRQVRDEIENLVMLLVLELRHRAPEPDRPRGGRRSV